MPTAFAALDGREQRDARRAAKRGLPAAKPD